MLEKLLNRPIIPVVVIDEADNAESLAESLLAGGIDVIEVTFRTAEAAKAIARIRHAFPDILVGAGTVLTAEQADQAIDAGAGFGLAPGLNPIVLDHFHSRDCIFIPGIMTPSEIENGLTLGCKLLKFFPAEPAGGLSALNTLAGPYAATGVKFCPTGGINLDNMTNYLNSPIVASVGGSWIATRQQIIDKDWKAITKQASDALDKLKAGSP